MKRMQDLMYQDVPDPSLSENAEGNWLPGGGSPYKDF